MTKNIPQIIYKDVNIPLSNEEMKVLFETRGKFRYVINYSDSKLKDTGLLFYTSNLELPAELDLNDKVSTDDKLSLVYEYMKMSNLVDINTLAHSVANILFVANDVEEISDTIGNSWLTKDEVDLFIERYPEEVSRWITFMNSLYVYALYIKYATEDNQNSNPISQMVPSKNDPTYIGNNFISVMSLPGFFEAYLTKELDMDNMFFFTHQFTEYCYQGKNLYPFFAVNSNWLYMLTLVLLEDENNATEDTTD